MKKIILVGAAPSDTLIPNPETDIEIWTVGRMCKELWFADKVFEMHKIPECNGIGYMEDLKLFEGEIFGLYPEFYPDIKMLKYPLNLVKPYGMVSNTICYMLAYARLQEPDIIELHRMPHISGDELLIQRWGVYYWIGQCEGAGIKVVDYSSLINRNGYYGEDEE